MYEGVTLMTDKDKPAVNEVARGVAVSAKTIAITGATGFVGRHICSGLIKQGYSVRVLVRRPEKAKSLFPANVDIVPGDILIGDTLEDLVRGADVCIHLVGIIFERPDHGRTFESMHIQATRNIVEACVKAGTGRFIHMSALGARADARARYHITKYEAEQIVRCHKLDWTIFRPSLIHGPDGEFTHQVSRWVRGKAPPFLFLPYFGRGLWGQRGTSLIQPVYIEDVVRAFVGAITTEESIGEVYALGGLDRLTWPEMLKLFRDNIPTGPKWRPVLGIPVWKALMITRAMALLGLGHWLPFNYDQVIMSQEDSICELARIQSHFNFTVRPFADSLAEYAHRL